MTVNADVVGYQRPLPSGTVTFLFSDIEGSTQPWESRRDAMQDALARHDALIRANIMDHEGVVFKTVGDAFCAVFPTAPSAVAAALGCQRTLVKEDWSAVDGLSVRMAVHTGDAHERDGDFFGPALNRVARLLAIGHGGQVLVSGVAAELAQSGLPSEVVLRDLGMHRLRDLAHPEQVFQLNAPDLPSEFPALRSLESLPNNLPLQVTSFVGRDAELSEIKNVLTKTRLLTLFGAGGVGKTRAAVQLGADLLDSYPEGVWFADLSSISDPELVPAALASALNLQESSDKSAAQTLVAAIKNNQMLVILDSCEHVVAAAAKLADTLLHGCPKLKVVATSREALGIGGEAVHRMPSLACPQSNEHIAAQAAMQYGAIALFAERARAADSKFQLTDENVPIVADICRRLDGIALAIELAAPRVKVLNLKTLAERLNERFRILTGGSRTALPRQQTMRALIDWSYDLLSQKEQQLFRMSAVFAGGWTLEAASAVCAVGDVEDFEVLDQLAALVDKSLVQVEFSESSQRYRLLESTRQYGVEKLSSAGERSGALRRHAEYFAEIASAAARAFISTPTYALRSQLEPELDNFRTALTWSLGEKADAALGQRLAGDLLLCPLATFDPPEGKRWAEIALATVDSATSLDVTGALWLGFALCEGALQRHRAAAEAGTRALAAYESLGDPLQAARARSALARALAFTGRMTEAKPLVQKALAEFRAANVPKMLGDCLETAGTAAVIDNDIAASRAYYREALPIVQAAGDERKVAVILANKAETEFQAGNLEEALQLIAQALALDRARRNWRSVANDLSNQAAYLTASQRNGEARSAALEAVQIAFDGRLESLTAWLVQHLAAASYSSGDKATAARLLGWVDGRVKTVEAEREYTEQQEYEKLMATMRLDFGESQLKELFEEGRLWKEEQAIAEAQRM